MYSNQSDRQREALAKANIRLALLLGGVVLLALLAMFYFWLSPAIPS